MIRRTKLALHLLVAIACAAPMFAGDITPTQFSIAFSDGRTPMTRRGHAIFRTLYFEVTGTSAWVARHVPRTEVGASISYSDITQARSWFGYTYGDPDDRVRGEALQAFVRRPLMRDGLSLQPYVEIGTGPMWSNRRVPAATSRFNFNSYLVVGATMFQRSHMPLRIGYRFSHISDGGMTGRNPGWDLHSVQISATLKRWR